MPRRQFINKKTATTFALLHRAQNDPLINDEDAPSRVFAEKTPQQPRRPTAEDYSYSTTGSVISSTSHQDSGAKKAKQRGDLEDEFGLNIRANEGEAAGHGVFFDDSQYDYMQHMRDLRSGEGPVTWVEAPGQQQQQQKGKGQGKGKQKLEDALRDLDLGSERGSRFEDAQSVGTQDSAARSLLPEEVLPSEFVRRRTYQDQQDVPDEIAGFQPDMDPDLRQVLEALEDEAFVDEDEDVFAELTRDGYEIEKSEYERLVEQGMFDEGEGLLSVGGDEDDGWESDDTIKASSPPLPALPPSPDGELRKPPEDTQAQLPADPTEGAWIDEFKKFKSEAKATKPPQQLNHKPTPSTLDSSAFASLASGHRKKRKGAKTSTTTSSMTSSALARTDEQTLLDSRFDKIEEEYSAAEELADEEGRFDDAISAVSGATTHSKASKYSATTTTSNMSGMSSYSRASDAEAPQLQRADFDAIMDDFLGGQSKASGGRARRRGLGTGMEQLDDIRKGLGPARVGRAGKVSS